MSLYTISQASAEVHLTPYTLRYYEKEGLLPGVKKRLCRQEKLSRRRHSENWIYKMFKRHWNVFEAN